jgi:hypothetical protein
MPRILGEIFIWKIFYLIPARSDEGFQIGAALVSSSRRSMLKG